MIKRDVIFESDGMVFTEWTYNDGKIFLNEYELKKLLDMETITIELGGRKYKVSPVEEELTLEECVGNCTYLMPSNPLESGGFPFYPTESIAEKVALYGLLQSVAHKLNGNNRFPSWWIYLEDGKLKIDDYPCSLDPLFGTKELAEQAIRIFANSKFDLKKLYQ